MQKLWRVSRILNNCNPFGDEIKQLNLVQIDFILRMYSREHPDEFTMADKELQAGEKEPQIYAEWHNKLRGKAKNEFGRSPALYLLTHYGWRKR